jgi:fructosamine-3-kinase
MYSEHVTDWLDVGDISSVVSVSRRWHHSRETNTIVVDDNGVLHKSGAGSDFQHEAEYLSSLPPRSAILFPRVLHVADDRLSYEMEYLDYATLAERYLFRPGEPSSWGYSIAQLISQVRSGLWQVDVDRLSLLENCREMYLHRVTYRFLSWFKSAVRDRSSRLIVNGSEMSAGTEALAKVQRVLEPLCSTPQGARIHGDLNFSNILYAPQAGLFRLVDPRGAFGGPGSFGDARYDVAKLRHSYNGMYDAAIFGLYSLSSRGKSEYELVLGPDRSTAIAAIDAALEDAGFVLEEIRAIEAALFLSMLPLHADDPDRQWVLYLRGLQLLHAIDID